MNMIPLERQMPYNSKLTSSQESQDRPLTATEVFEELKQRLDGMGYLPDEYFLMDSHWEGGREIPKGADIFCTTDYGESEGIYLDVYLKWYEDGKPITKSFITGKTLGESGADLDRMFLISSAITKAFHGDGGTYARFISSSQPEPNSMIVSLDAEEQRTLLDALIQRRDSLLSDIDRTDQLLRRMTGSITAYMDEVGQRPLHISDFDKAMLAICDGECEALVNLLPKVGEHKDELLVAAAGRPGRVGREMTAAVLSAERWHADDVYGKACKEAIKTGDTVRVANMLGEARFHCQEDENTVVGEVIHHAYRGGGQSRHMVVDMLRCVPDEAIAAAPPQFLVDAARNGDFQTCTTLVKRGLHPTERAGEVVKLLCDNNSAWIAERLLDGGLSVHPQDYPAMHACIAHGAVGVGKRLVDQGMNFEDYRGWAEEHGRLIDSEEAHAVWDYWEDSFAEQYREDRSEMEMSL